MSQTISIRQIILFLIYLLLFVAVCYFLYIAIMKVAQPLLLQKQNKSKTPVSVDKSLDEVMEYLTKREDLTLSSPSATLTKEANKISSSSAEKVAISAEVVNSSGVAGVATALADELKSLGITASVRNGTTITEGTVVALKTKAASYKDTIAAKLSSDSATIRFEDLSDDEEFDIRITIGK